MVAMDDDSSPVTAGGKQFAGVCAEAHLEIKKRKVKATANREKLMSQMAAMQQKFLSQHQDELDEVDYGAESAM